MVKSSRQRLPVAPQSQMHNGHTHRTFRPYLRTLREILRRTPSSSPGTSRPLISPKFLFNSRISPNLPNSPKFLRALQCGQTSQELREETEADLLARRAHFSAESAMLRVELQARSAILGLGFTGFCRVYRVLCMRVRVYAFESRVRMPKCSCFWYNTKQTL